MKNSEVADVYQKPVINHKKKPLFRTQVVESSVSKQYGTVILAQPIGHTILTILFATVAIAIMAFIFFFSTTKKANSQGILLPTSGAIRIYPSQAGLITERRIQEGQKVKKGDVLFVLSNERNDSGSISAEQNIANILKNRRDSLNLEMEIAATQSVKRIDALTKQIKSLEDQISNSESQVALHEQRVSLQLQSYERFHSLEKKNYISTAQLQEKQSELFDQQNILADKKQAIEINKRNLENALADIENLRLEAQRDQHALDRQRRSIDQDLVEVSIRKAMYIRAPQNGVITAITTEVGQTISSNSGLATILPDGSKLEAEINVPSRSIGFIKPGMSVLIRYQAFPYQKFGQYRAKVRDISNTALSPNDLGISGTVSSLPTMNEPLYRIRLDLESQYVHAYGNRVSLKSGMRLEASIALDHRRLYEWILEPIYSITGRT